MSWVKHSFAVKGLGAAVKSKSLEEWVGLLAMLVFVSSVPPSLWDHVGILCSLWAALVEEVRESPVERPDDSHGAGARDFWRAGTLLPVEEKVKVGGEAAVFHACREPYGKQTWTLPRGSQWKDISRQSNCIKRNSSCIHETKLKKLPQEWS